MNSLILPTIAPVAAGLSVDMLMSMHLVKNGDILDVLMNDPADYQPLILSNLSALDQLCYSSTRNGIDAEDVTRAMMFRYILQGEFESFVYAIDPDTIANRGELKQLLDIARRLSEIDSKTREMPVIENHYCFLLYGNSEYIATQQELLELKWIWVDLMQTEAGQVVKKMFLSAQVSTTQVEALIAVELFGMLIEPIMMGALDDAAAIKQNRYLTDTMDSILGAFKVFARNVIVFGVPSAIWKPVFDRFIALELNRRMSDGCEFEDMADECQKCILDIATIQVGGYVQMSNVDVDIAVEFAHHFAEHLYLDVSADISRSQTRRNPSLFVREYLSFFLVKFPREVTARIYARFDAEYVPFTLAEVENLRVEGMW